MEKEKINLQFFIGNYAQNQSLPTFIFGNDKFNYTPQYCRQYTKNYKGLIISFPGLIKAYNNGIIKKDLEHVCTYYFKRKRGKQNSLDIYVKDEKTLNDGVFLNDGIVNFYLKIIEDEYTYQDGQNNVLIQKSFFYNSLSNQQNSNCSNDFCYPDSCSFIKTKINVFSFKTLIIPICENYHWSLIIVNDIDKMKNIFTKNNLDEMNNNCCTSNNNIEINEEECDYPEIFYLDSFYDLNTRRMTIILKYLFYEYQKIYSIQCNMAEFLKSNFDKIECYSLDVPKQNNSYDCGIYLLIYAELFLYDTNYFLKNSSKKYNSNNNDKESQIFKIGNTAGGGCNNANNFNNFSNDNIINTSSINNNNLIGNNVGDNNNMNNISNNINNILNEQNRNINEFNITSCNNNASENMNENRIVLNDLNLIKINENKVNDNNNIIDDAKLKNEEIGQKENNQENQDINKNINNKDDQSLDRIDIEIEEGENKIKNNEGNNLNENKNGGNNHDEINNQNENHPMAYNDMKYDQINEKSLKNWFSSDLVNNQRNKIKNLITELSKIEKEIINNNNKENIIKEKQSFVIKKYIEEQKREFDDYFSKLKE